MENILKSFAEEYDLKIDRKIYNDDSQRSANNPILFVFIGNSTREASEYISSTIQEKWDNGRGIAFINILTDINEDKDNSFNFQFSCDLSDKKHLRKSVRDKFYNDKKILQDLNSKITMVRDKILSYGNLFNSFDGINISVVTMADDPLNIILPEVTLLIRKRMLEVFKLSTADLYVLIKEKNIEDEFFSQAASVSFFREVEYIQKNDFIFDEKIAVYGEERELPITWQGPIFYMTYLLEEKSERGTIPAASMKNNYEIISYINLLKNRNVSIETYSDTENQHYDNSRFKANINIDKSVNRYITAGLSKVKRPNGAIAVTVVRAFYERILKQLDELSKRDREFIAKALKIDENSIASRVESIVPNNITVMDMNGIMMSNSSNIEKRLSKLTLRQVEEGLYEDRCENFFCLNFKNVAEKNIQNINLEKEIRTLLNDNVLNNPKLGLYCAWKWTSDEGEGIKYIRDSRDLVNRHIENIKSEIDSIYESRFIEGFSFMKLFSKGGNIQEVRKRIFLDIYGKRFELLKLSICEKIMEKYEEILLKIHDELYEEINQLNFISEGIKKYEENMIKLQEEYMAQNVKIYYRNVINSIIDKLEKNHGKAFYLSDKYIGSLSQNLKKGQEELLRKIIYFCNKYIITEQEFNKSFEEEFNERANVNVEDLGSKVLSKEELYRKLYNILDSNSELKCYLMNYDVKRYQEKYFFGDYSSDFIKYAFDFDRKTRNYKIGYIHERRSSGIEKLNLMGGFGVKDIIYVRNAIDFYNYCIGNGYMMHGIAIEKLPKIT